jgi:hypothetical protein
VEAGGFYMAGTGAASFSLVELGVEPDNPHTIQYQPLWNPHETLLTRISHYIPAVTEVDAKIEQKFRGGNMVRIEIIPLVRP